MRNLKKVLALVLAFAMTLSFSFVATAASFPDVSSGTNVGKAVDLLSGLGVIGGYPDGTFGPEKTISRAEFLKILFVLTNGTGEESLYAGGNSKYSDVTADKWYASYVNWATQLNIVGGYPDGTFKPDDPVKVSEASKMYVVALGYAAADYVFPYGFIDRAKKSGLFEDISGVGAEDPAPRGIIAQMGYNFLFVEDGPAYSYWDRTISDWNFRQPLKQTFNADDAAATVLATSNAVYNSGITKSGKVQFKYASSTAIEDTTINCDDLIGHAVTVWKVPDKDNTSKWNIIAVVDEAEFVVKASASTMVVATGNVDSMERYDVYTSVDGTNVPLFLADRNSSDKPVNSYVKYWDTLVAGSKFVINGGASDPAFSTLTGLAPNVTNASVDYTFIDNEIADENPSDPDWEKGDPHWDSIYVSYWKTGEVTSVSSTSIAIEGINNGGAIPSEQIKGSISSFKKGDYANVTVTKGIVNNSAADIYTIQKADVLSAVKVTSISSTNKTITVAGTAYKLSAFSKLNTVTDIALNTETNVVLDKGGFLYYADTVDAIANYMLIKDVANKDANSFTSTAKVTGLLADGTTQTFVLSDKYQEVKASGNNYFDKTTGKWLNVAGGDAGTDIMNVAALGALVIYETNGDGEIETLYHTASPALDTSGLIDGTDVKPETIEANAEFKLDSSNDVIYKKVGTGSYAMNKFVSDSTVVFIFDKPTGAIYSDLEFTVTTAAKMSSFEDTKFAFYAVDPDDSTKATAIFITDEIGSAHGVDNLLAMRAGGMEISVNGTIATATLDLYVNGARKTVTTLDVTVEKNATYAAARAKIIKDIFNNKELVTAAYTVFGYADIDSNGKLVQYYEGAVADRLAISLSMEENDTRTKGSDKATVYRGAVLAVNNNVVTFGLTDANGRALDAAPTTVSGKLVYKYDASIRPMFPLASDVKITVIDAEPKYDNGEELTVTAGTVSSLYLSSEGTTGKSYVVDFTLRERSSTKTFEISQIIVYKQPVDNFSTIA